MIARSSASFLVGNNCPNTPTPDHWNYRRADKASLHTLGRLYSGIRGQQFVGARVVRQLALASTCRANEHLMTRSRLAQGADINQLDCERLLSWRGVRLGSARIGSRCIRRQVTCAHQFASHQGVARLKIINNNYLRLLLMFLFAPRLTQFGSSNGRHCSVC